MTARVYIIASAAGVVKVGISRNPTARMRELRTGHPYLLTLFREFERPRGDAAKVEFTAHRILRDKRRHGTEWFDVTPAEAAVAVETACEAADAFALPPATPGRRLRYNEDDPEEAEAWAKQNPGQLAREIKKWSRQR